MKKNYWSIFLIVLVLSCSARQQTVLPLIDRSEQEKEEKYSRSVRYPAILVRLTNRWRDSLLYNQDTILINYSPLLDFDGMTRAILHPDETLITANRKKEFISFASYQSGHCDRAYTASWYILNNKLYLGKVTPREFYIEKGSAIFFSGRQKIKQTTINRRIERATGRKYENGLMFADWVNSPIKGTIGGVPDPYETVIIINSPKNVTIYVKNGIVEQVEIVPAPCTHDQSRNNHLTKGRRDV